MVGLGEWRVFGKIINSTMPLFTCSVVLSCAVASSQQVVVVRYEGGRHHEEEDGRYVTVQNNYGFRLSRAASP